MAFGRRGDFSRPSPAVRMARELDPEIKGRKEEAFLKAVAQRGGDLSNLTADEFYAMRKAARLEASNKVYGKVKDPEWSYNPETGRFRRRPHITVLIAIGVALAAAIGKYGRQWLLE